MKSATDVMTDVIFSAVLDAVEGFKSAAKGVPNALARDLSAVHRNTTSADLPAEVRAAMEESVRQAFARLRREGYTVAAADATRAPPPRPRPAGPPRGQGPRSGPRDAPVVETKRRPPGGPKGGKGPPRGRP